MTGDTGFSHSVNALRLLWPTPANDAVVALTTRERCVKWALASRAAENPPYDPVFVTLALYRTMSMALV